jgi:hypothetical protein
MFDDNFHICMIYGIEIKSINQSIKIDLKDKKCAYVDWVQWARTGTQIPPPIERYMRQNP